MFTGDKSAGMVGSIAEVFPDAAYQRCAVHFCCNVLAKVPKSKRPRVAAMLKAIHAMELREASKAKALAVALELDGMKLKEAAGVARDGYVEALTYARFPVVHWRRIRSNNAIELITRKTRRRTRIVGTFPDGRPALMLVTARRKYVAEGEWGSRRHLDVTLLEEWPHGADLGAVGKCARILTVPSRTITSPPRSWTASSTMDGSWSSAAPATGPRSRSCSASQEAWTRPRREPKCLRDATRKNGALYSASRTWLNTSTTGLACGFTH